MKKTLVSVVLCLALLSSFIVSASAEFTSSDSTTLSNIYNQLTAVRDQLGYPGGGFSSLRQAINYIADHIPSSPKDYSTVLSNIKYNSDSLVSYIELIEGDTNNISARSTELLNKLNDVYLRQGQMQIAITNHTDSASALNHSDISDFSSLVSNIFYSRYTGPVSSYSDTMRYFLYDYDGGFSLGWFSFGGLIDRFWANLTSDHFGGSRLSLYGLVHQLQQVLASDADLQLKKDNKANEDAATDAFVNGNSSKTSLGTADIGNLKDVGGIFNDLTSLNGQSSVSSFFSGLSSADGTGQGWFSESTRASLDSVSAPVTTTRLVQKTWRGEKSLIYSISDDTSVNGVWSPSPAQAPVVDSDPYNMSGFVDNYNWLWGDAS